MAILETASEFFISRLERFFYWWGTYIARKPYVVILGSLFITGLTCIGFLKLNSESRAEKLWIPTDSPYLTNKAWLDINFPRNIRTQLAIYTSNKNVLEPKTIIRMLELHDKIKSIETRNSTWENLCFRVPIADIFLSRKKRQISSDKNTAKSDPNLLTPKTVKIAAKINVATPPVEESTSAYVRDTIPTLSTETTKASPQVTGVTTDRKPKVVAVDIEEDEDPKNPFSSYDYKESKQGVIKSIWSSDYSDYEEYDLNSENVANADSLVDEDKEIGSDLPPEIYCDLVNTLNDKCLESSLLELWKFDRKVIEKLTTKNILDAINTANESPFYGYKFNYSDLLGDIERNSTGHIVGAKSILHIWTTSIIEMKHETEELSAGIELDLADPVTLEWEKSVAEEMLRHSADDITVLANVGRSFSDVSTQAIFFDAVKMVSGWLLMFAYTMLMLGRFNLIEHRTYLSAAGFFAVGMGLIISLGLTFAIGMPYTPMHAILPFLYLGIGIDDMFVIVQCWYNLPHDEIHGKPLHERIGLTLQHAGVAITVTSMTDVFAFGIGAVTILPGLQAFCVTCAIGIGSIYLLQASWFVAWFSIDQRRVEARRDGFFPCITHKNWTPPQCSQKEFGKSVMIFIAGMLRYRLYKIFIVFSTLLFTGIGTWGALQIRQEFDPILLLPAESYLRQWIDLHDKQWPQNGWVADVYTGHFDPSKDPEKLDKLVDRLQQLSDSKHILKSIDVWWTNFKTFIEDEKNVTDWNETLGNQVSTNSTISSGDIKSFEELLSDFLFSRKGSKFKNNFRFAEELVCNKPAPKILATQFTITYLPFAGPEEHIPGRKAIEQLIVQSNFSSDAFSFSKVYAAWETDEVIGYELWRNLGLGIVCVFVITIILLADLRICFFVLVCVFLTLVDIVGFLHFWDITIDTLSCINIVLAIGLCVDYSAHVAHAFIVSKGSRLKRAQDSLTTMGPAIVNGGITTFLALLLLGFSQSHVFVTFFKVFLLTVAFGLFHGLIFLPVILSFLGSSKNDDLSKYDTSSDTNSTDVDTIPPSASGSKSKAGVLNDAFEYELPGLNSLMESWNHWRRKNSLVRPKSPDASEAV